MKRGTITGLLAVNVVLLIFETDALARQGSGSPAFLATLVLVLTMIGLLIAWVRAAKNGAKASDAPPFAKPKGGASAAKSMPSKGAPKRKAR
jgi:hypothetical protein